MNVRDHLLATIFPNVLEDSLDEQLRDRLLNATSGANDGTTHGDILAEMPLDSNCGDDCKDAVDKCKAFLDVIAMAYGDDNEFREQVIGAAVDACCCFIRG